MYSAMKKANGRRVDNNNRWPTSSQRRVPLMPWEESGSPQLQDQTRGSWRGFLHSSPAKCMAGLALAKRFFFRVPPQIRELLIDADGRGSPCCIQEAGFQSPPWRKSRSSGPSVNNKSSVCRCGRFDRPQTLQRAAEQCSQRAVKSAARLLYATLLLWYNRGVMDF